MNEGGCVVYGYRNERGRPWLHANRLGRASTFGRSGRTDPIIYDVAVVAQANEHFNQIRDRIFRGAGGGPSPLRNAFAWARENPGQAVHGVTATTVLPINGSQGAGLGRTTVDWTGSVMFDEAAGKYIFNAVGVVRPQTFSTADDGNNVAERAGIAVWAGTMCRGCSEYEQLPSAEMLARFEFNDRPVSENTRR